MPLRVVRQTCSLDVPGSIFFARHPKERDDLLMSVQYISPNLLTAPYQPIVPTPIPLQSSVAAMNLLYMPKVLLNLAVLLYTIGFGIYLLYSWIYHAERDAGRDDFRNVFIAFVATVGLVYLIVVMVDAFAFADEWKRTADFNLDRTATFAKPVSQKRLEEWLETLYDMQSTTVGVGALYAKLETAVNDLQTKWESERIEQEKRREEHLEAQKRRRATRVATGQA